MVFGMLPVFLSGTFIGAVISLVYLSKRMVNLRNRDRDRAELGRKLEHSIKGVPFVVGVAGFPKANPALSLCGKRLLRRLIIHLGTGD